MKLLSKSFDTFKRYPINLLLYENLDEYFLMKISSFSWGSLKNVIEMKII